MGKILKLLGKLLLRVGYVVVVLLASAIIFTLGIGVLFRNDAEKLRNTKPGTSYSAIQNEWGQPDRTFNNNKSTKAVFYDQGILGDSYVFIIDKQTDTLVFATVDD